MVANVQAADPTWPVAFSVGADVLQRWAECSWSPAGGAAELANQTDGREGHPTEGRTGALPRGRLKHRFSKEQGSQCQVGAQGHRAQEAIVVNPQE